MVVSCPSQAIFKHRIHELLMGTKEIMQEYPKAQTVSELDEMLLKVCHEANNESISDAEFRGMIYDLMLRKVELMEDRMPKVRLT